MKITHKIMASALLLAIGLSAASAADLTNDWFRVDFTSGYTANGLITNSSGQAGGIWTSTNDIPSIMTNYTGKGNIGMINGLGGSLIWTPTNAAAGGKAVLLDADVYMVGSEDAPSVSMGTVQTEVFMTNVSASVSYLCAHVGEGWVKLDGVAVTNQTWINLRIEINYVPETPEVSFQVNGILMYKAGFSGTTSFSVMAAGAGQSKVTSVSFMGTGYLDNFVGRTVTPPRFGSGGTDTNNGTPGSGGTVEEGSGVVNATFNATNGGQAIRYVQMTGPNGYVRSIRTENGNVSFSTVGLPAGTYSIIGYYGTAPSLAQGTTPAAVAVGANKATEVVGGNISFTVAPKSGVYYTLFAGPNSTSLTAGADSTVALPANEDAGGFIKLAMPVPTVDNEVKIIKIYASDENYAKDAAAPTN